MRYICDDGVVSRGLGVSGAVVTFCDICLYGQQGRRGLMFLGMVCVG